MHDLFLFDTWNNEKKLIHSKVSETFYVNQREIWFVKMGKNIGYEENGKEEFVRPVLVIKKVGNLFFTVALTTKGKRNNRFYHFFQDVFFTQNHKDASGKSSAILSQVRVLDKKRFQEKIGYVGEEEFAVIKQKITDVLL